MVAFRQVSTVPASVQRLVRCLHSRRAVLLPLFWRVPMKPPRTPIARKPRPDTPELPAGIDAKIDHLIFAVKPGWKIENERNLARLLQKEIGDSEAWDIVNALSSLRSVIAKHLLTAEEARHATSIPTFASSTCTVCQSAYEKLRRLSGSAVA